MIVLLAATMYLKAFYHLDFNSSQRAAEDRQRWQKIVADVNSGAPTTLMVPGHRKQEETDNKDISLIYLFEAFGILFIITI